MHNSVIKNSLYGGFMVIKKKIMLLISCFSLLFTAMTIITLKNIDVGNAFAGKTQSEYSFVFNNEKNVSDDECYLGLSETGGRVYFTKYNINRNDYCWGTLSGPAYFYNNDAISGITSMTIVFSDHNCECGLSWTWQDCVFDAPGAHIDIDSSVELTQTFTFDYESPNYIRIECGINQICSIESMIISYSCQQGIRPSEYDNQYTVSFYDSFYDYSIDGVRHPHLIEQKFYEYKSKLTSIPNPPDVYHGSFLYWEVNGEELDPETFIVTSNVEIYAFCDWDLDYIDYSLNDDGETYTMIVSSDLAETVVSLDGDSFDLFSKRYVIRGTVPSNESLISKIVFSTNCTVIFGCSKFSGLEEIVFGEDVELVKSRFAYDSPSLSRVTFEGDVLPEFESGAFDINNRNFTDIRFFVSDSIYSSLEHKYIQGYRVHKIGEEIVITPSMTLAEYKHKTNEQSIAIADYLYRKCESDFERKTFSIPFSCRDGSTNSINGWKTIKEFAINLTSSLTNDYDKASTIYKWIQTNIEYDDIALDYSPIRAFIERKAVCAQFVYLMHDMLSAINIPSLYISGYRSLPDNISVVDALNNGYYYSSSHGWLVSLLNGEWKFSDVTSSSYNYIPGHFAMDLQTFNSSGYVAKNVEHIISCVPEEIDLDNFEFPFSAVVFREGKIRGPVTGVVTNGLTYEASQPFSYSYFEQYGGQYDVYHFNNSTYDYGELMTSYVSMLDYDFRNDSIMFYTSSCIGIRMDLAIKYLLEDFSMVVVNQIFDNLPSAEIDENLNFFSLNNEEYVYRGTGSSLETIVAPGTFNDKPVTTIARTAFCNTIDTKNVYISEGVTTLFTNCFGNSLIESIYLPSTLSTIFPIVFENCSAHVYLKNSLNDINCIPGWNSNSECVFHENYDW